jgi:uncharacterized protein YyaL (SSP411 family)
MLEDNALLARVYFQATRVLGDPGYADIAKEIHGWLNDVMYDPETGAYAGSQDADQEEAYYGLPLSERAELPTPFIDRTLFVGWNALLVSSFVERYRLFQEQDILDGAVRTYDFLKNSVWPRHYFAEGRAQGEAYLIGDVTAMLGAALDLAEAVAESKPYLDDARSYALSLLDRLHDSDSGGFVDAPVMPEALGALSQPKKEIATSSMAASALLRLYAHTSDAAYLHPAVAALELYGHEYRRYSFFAAGYASAVDRLLTPDAHVVIVGDGEAAALLRKTVWATCPIGVVVEARSMANANEYPASPDGAALAYICMGTACQPPISDSKRLKEALLASSIFTPSL